MKKYIYIVALFLMVPYANVFCQINDTTQVIGDSLVESVDTLNSLSVNDFKRPLIYDSIFSVNNGDSVLLVEIFQDRRIEKLLSDKQNAGSNQVSSVLQGFRVQVFSSNQQRTAREQAIRIKQEIESVFPDFPVYIVYQSPFWKVRIGNFKTSEEAQLLRTEIIKKYPKKQGDVYVVKERIGASI